MSSSNACVISYDNVPASIQQVLFLEDCTIFENLNMDPLEPAKNHLFPTKTSFIIFVSYISLFVSQGLLVTAVQKSKIRGFNSIVVVLLTELVKLFICVIVYLSRFQHGLTDLFLDIKKNSRLLVLYLAPSFLYCLYNNLTYINLQLFDLTTYYCLMQFRTVLTAIIYQILFKRQLTAAQWISLIILTLGCLIKEYGLYDNLSETKLNSNTTRYDHMTISRNSSEKVETSEFDKIEISPFVRFAWLTLLILFQMFCSCFAGVYNEYLLKDSSSNSADVILQNIFMYLDSILCNLIVFKLSPTPIGNKETLNENISVITILHNLLTNPLVIILLLNNAFSGLMASFFLKSLNSILKTFASALELFAVALLAWILFDNHIDLHTITALFMVSAAMFVYSRNPVSVAPPGRTSESKDGFMLLPTTEE